MSAPSTDCSQGSILLWFFWKFSHLLVLKNSISFSRSPAQCLALPVKASWRPQTNAVSFFSVPPQHFIKHRNYKLSLLCLVNITHQTVPRSEATLYFFLFLIVRAYNIIGTKWVNEYPPAGPSRVPKAIAFCRKIHVQLMKLTYLQNNPILAMAICTTPLLTFSNTGMRELFPWLPSRNGNADAADIFGDDSTEQIKLVFSFISTVTD